MTKNSGADARGAEEQAAASSRAAAAAATPTRGRRRLEWLATIGASRKYSPLTVHIASLFGWKYSDNKTGETFVGIAALMAETGAEKRAVQRAISSLRDDHWLTKVGKHAPGKPTVYRLTIPVDEPASAAAVAPVPSAVAPAATLIPPPRAAQRPDYEDEEPPF